MVTTVGNNLQAGKLNPYQKQANEQDRDNNIGKTGEDDARAQKAQRNSSSAPVEQTREKDADVKQKNFIKASSDQEDTDRNSGRTRGVNLDITV